MQITTNHTQPGTLCARTRELLHNCGKSLVDVHKSSGLPFYWLRKFSSGEIKEPSANRVQRLYEHLAGRKLPL